MEYEEAEQWRAIVSSIDGDSLVVDQQHGGVLSGTEIHDNNPQQQQQQQYSTNTIPKQSNPASINSHSSSRSSSSNRSNISTAATTPSVLQDFAVYFHAIRKLSLLFQQTVSMVVGILLKAFRGDDTSVEHSDDGRNDKQQPHQQRQQPTLSHPPSNQNNRSREDGMNHDMNNNNMLIKREEMMKNWAARELVMPAGLVESYHSYHLCIIRSYTVASKYTNRHTLVMLYPLKHILTHHYFPSSPSYLAYITLLTVSRVEIHTVDEFMSICVLPKQPQLITNFQQQWGYQQTNHTNHHISSSTSSINHQSNDKTLESNDDKQQYRTTKHEVFTSTVLFTKDLLLQQFGDSLVRVSMSPSGRFDGPENGALWGLSDQIGNDLILSYILSHFTETHIRTLTPHF